MLEDLPVHPFTRLTALGVLPSGRPVWPVLGGAPDDQGDGGDDDDLEETDDDGDAGDEGEDTDGDEGQEDQDDKPLGPKGERALQAVKAKLKAERSRRRAAEARLGQGGKTGDGPGKDTPDAETIRKEAEEAATARANQRIIRSEVRAAAAGKLANPKLALKLLDLDQFEVDADGEVDEDEIADAINDLIKENPGLAAQGGKRFQGTGDGGAKPKPPKERPKSLREAYARKHG
jgi:hypothetical protein